LNPIVVYIASGSVGPVSVFEQPTIAKEKTAMSESSVVFILSPLIELFFRVTPIYGKSYRIPNYFL
jgi:hypothetical protein